MRNVPISVGVVFTTYNRPQDLERVLAGYARQSFRDFEIVIADDGSGDSTRECIMRARDRWDLDIRHIWHEDAGFRKCTILNRAVVETPAEYLIFTDGDCIPHPEFVRGHAGLARPGHFVSGGCVRLGGTTTRAVTADDVLTGRAFEQRWLQGHGESPINLRKLALSADPWRGVMNTLTTTRPTWNGHNASTWREEVLAVNGFDERLGYGGLDREFGERLERCGMKAIQARYSLICLHLDHPRPYRAREIMDANMAIRRDNARRNVRRTAHGLGLRRGEMEMGTSLISPDVSSPFGAFVPSRGRQRLLRFSQRAPDNLLGKQLARFARDLYLWRSPQPVDVTVGSIRLRCYLRDNTSERKFVFTPWRFDPLERSVLASSLPRDGVFVDIGANVGIYTLSAALQLGPAGRIVAFEPYTPAYQRLLFNIAATRALHTEWPRIDALQLGISDRDAICELRVDAGNLGGGSIAAQARFSRHGSHESTAIRCRALADILGELAITRIDVLKIDIEGAEDRALVPFLSVAPDALLPRRIVLENSDELWGTDVRAALTARGYAPQLRTRLNTVYAR